MVDFLHSPNSEEAKENKKGLQSFSDLKKPQNNPSEFTFSDSEDSSLAFLDSLLNFDCIGDLIEEGPESFTSMASLGSAENAVFEECINLGCDGLSERSRVVEGIVEEVGKTADFVVTEQEKGVDDRGDFLREKDFDRVGMIGDEAGNLDDFGYLIEEEMGKVTLDSVSSCLVPNTVEGIGGEVCLNGNGTECDVDGGHVIEIAVGSSDHPPSESEEETSSSSSGTSSSSDDDDDDDDDDDKEEDKREVKGKFETFLQGASSSKKEIIDIEVEMEEGEIIASDIDETVAWSGDEDDEDVNVASKNELRVLSPVPPVTVTLQPHHQTVPVGVVLSIVGAQVIVEGIEKHNPLDEGSIMWITETRSPLGMVDETFGPVKNPYYIIRHNSESEVPSGLKPGDSVCFVPEFANHILHDKSLYAKAYDASGANDEEISEEEFSDDEKEAEYRKMLKMKKRAKNHENVENKKMERQEAKTMSGNWKCDHAPRQNAGQGNQVRENHWDPVPPPVVPPKMDLGNNNKCSSSIGHDSNVRPGFAPPFSPFRQNPGFTMQSAGANDIPFQRPQSMGVAQNPGFTMQSSRANGIPFQPPQSMGVAQNPGFTMQSAGANGVPFQPPQSMGFAQNPGFTMQSSGANSVPFQPPQSMSMGVAQKPGFTMQSAGANGIPFQPPQSMGVPQNPGFTMQSAGANGIPFQPPQSTGVPQNPGFTMQSAGANGSSFQPPQSMGVAQNPGFTNQSAGANGASFRPPENMGVAQNPGFTMQSAGANGISFQPPQSMGVDGFPTINSLPWLAQVNPQILYQMIMQNGLAAFGQQTGMNSTSLPQNPVFPSMQPGFGSGPGFSPWPSAGFGQNMFDPSVFAMVAAQGQQLLFPFNAGQQAFPLNLQQMGHNSSINTNLATTSQPQMSVTSSQGPYQNLSNPSQIGQQVFASNIQQVAPSSSVKPDLISAGTSQGLNQGSCQNEFNSTSQFGMAAASGQQQQQQQQQHSLPSAIEQMGFNSSMKPNTAPFGRPDTSPSSNQGRGGGTKPHHSRRGGGRFGGGRG